MQCATIGRWIYLNSFPCCLHSFCHVEIGNSQRTRKAFMTEKLFIRKATSWYIALNRSAWSSIHRVIGYLYRDASLCCLNIMFTRLFLVFHAEGTQRLTAGKIFASLHNVPGILVCLPNKSQYHAAAHFTSNFSIAIAIRSIFRLRSSKFWVCDGYKRFAHGTTAVLSWHVQNVLAISWIERKASQIFSSHFNYDGNIFSEMGPWFIFRRLYSSPR